MDGLSDVSDLSELCNISDVGEEELLDITSICELYFLEESISSHVEDTQKDFFAEWKHIPLGEKMMEIYIDFSKGDIKMPPSWMTLASSATRHRYISAACGMAILKEVPQEVMIRVLFDR